MGSEGVAALDQTAVALADGDDFDALLEGRPDGGAEGGVHAGRVAAAGQDAEPVFWLFFVHQMPLSRLHRAGILTRF